MALDLGQMYASVILDDGNFQAGLNRMQSSADGVFKKIAAAAASYLSWRGIASVSQAFMTQQDAVEGVRSALRNLGRDVEGNTARFSRFASEMQKITKYGDESTLAVMAQGMKLGIDPAQIENVTKSAMGLSQKLGIDLPTAMMLLARASHGHTAMLSRYGVKLDENLSKEEQFQQILKQGTDSFSLVTDAAKTASGQLAQAMNALSDSKEKIGGIALESLLPVANAVKDISTAFNNLDPAMQKLIVSAGTLVSALTAMSGLGILGRANNFIASVSASISNTQILLNAENAAEAARRAEYAKTDAMRERHAQAQLIRVARIRRAEAQTAVTNARNDFAAASRSGNTAAVTQARRQLAEAEANLTRSQIAESQATQALTDKHRAAMIASRQHAAAARVNAAAQRTAAASMTVSGRAAMFARNSFRAAGVAARGLVTALGPLGIAMIAISGLYAAIQYQNEKFNNEISGSLNLAKQRSSQANEQAEANRKLAETETTQFKRLQELSRYQRLNNTEKKEAEKLIESLRSKYAGLDIQIDSTTGKIKIAAGAWEQMNEAQRKAARSDLLKQASSAAGLTSAMQNSVRNQLGSWWLNRALIRGAVITGKGFISRLTSEDRETHERNLDRAGNTDLQNEFDDILKLKTAEEQLAGFEKLRNKLLSANQKTEADAVSELIKQMKTELDLKKQLAGSKTKNGSGAGSGSADPEELKKKAEAERKARQALAKQKWEIKFEFANPAAQVRMLNERIQKIFKRQSGKYATLDAFKDADKSKMTEQELKDLTAIVELEGKRRAIQKQGKRSIMEQKNADRMDAEQRTRAMQEKIFARQLEQLREDGRIDAARQLLNREYAAAKKKAEMLEKEYASAAAKAWADGNYTEKEKRLLAEARRKMQEAQQRQDSLEDQVYRENRKQHQTQVNAAWSVAALADQLYGNSSAEKQIARNTHNTSNLLTRIDSKVDKIKKSAASLSYG